MVKNPPANAGNAGDPWVRNIPQRNGNTHKYFCLGNPMESEAWWGTVHGVQKESDMT